LYFSSGGMDSLKGSREGLSYGVISLQKRLGHMCREVAYLFF
jgi:hypothetical protein